MAGVDTNRLRELIAERSRSARDVSLKAGLGETAVKDILAGRNKRPALETLRVIADELGLSLAEFAASATGDEGSRDSRVVPAFLPVRYKVAAGLWFEADAYAQDFADAPQAVVPDREFGEWPQWLELVEGDSVDLEYPAGFYVHVVDAIEMGYAARDGDFVVVERRRNGGETRERTVKEVRIAKGRMELWPRSSNPKWSGPVKLDGADGIEVEIVGLVIGGYKPARRRQR